MLLRNPEELQQQFQAGMQYYQNGAIDAAESCFREILQQIPKHPEVLHILGLIEQDKGNITQALQLIEQSIKINPRKASFYRNLAGVYQKQGNWQTALMYLQKAVEIQPDYAVAYNLIGIVYQEQQQWQEAIDSYLKAVEIQPDYADAYNNLGLVYQYLHDYEQAIAYHLKALEVKPNWASAYNNLGNAYHRIGEIEKAAEALGEAAKLMSDFAEIRCNLGLNLLLEGKLTEGWQEYEWRLKMESLQRFEPKTPMWNGEDDLQGKSIVLWSEQGLGDAIQFVRYARILQQRGAKVIVSAHRALVPLFEQCWQGIDLEVVESSCCDIYSYDYHASVMSLPRIFNTTLKNIPADIPYLFPPTSPHPDALLPSDDTYRIGIVWASKITAPQYQRKSCSPQYFIDLLSLGNVSLYSLQVGADANKIEPYLQRENVYDLSSKLTDFAVTASVISQLDLVITIDTAVAHLAGAMGKPVWVLLPFVPDWRWLMHRQDSPWYPTMRLFRQPSLADWDGVFQQVQQQLQLVLAGESPLFPVKSPKRKKKKHKSKGFQSVFKTTATNLSPHPPNSPSPNLPIPQSPHPPNSPSPHQTSPQQLLETGLQLHRQGKIAEAKTYYQQVLKLHPNHPDALHLLGVVTNQQGDATSGINLIKQAIEIHDAQPSYYQNLAIIYTEIGEKDAAKQNYQKVLELDPQNKTAHQAIASFSQSPEFDSRGLNNKDQTIIGIPWTIDPTTGWGNYGLNLVLQLQKSAQYTPAILSPPHLESILNPIGRQIIVNLLQQQQSWQKLIQQHLQQGKMLKLNNPILHPLGNGIDGSSANHVWGDKNIGVIFFEDTCLTSEAIARSKSYDLIVAGSSWNAQVLNSYGLTHVQTILQGIEPTQFHPAPKSGVFGDWQSHSACGARFVVFSGGKLEYRKGQDIIVAAFRRFVTRHPDALLITAWHTFFPQFMLGLDQTGNVQGLPQLTSDKRLQIQDWLVANGIPPQNCMDLGIVSHYVMGQVIREADAAVFTNRCEGGTNLVAMECLACGIPTILSANTGHLDLIDNKHCYPLQSQSPVKPTPQFRGVQGWGESEVDEVVETLEHIYQNRTQAQQKGAAAAEFMQDWTWEKQIQRLTDVIESLS